MNTVVQILDSIAGSARAERTDGQLLDLFVRLRDDDAFASVVRRHGPMVLGVCRRVLRNPADADDAFQAAFLVLARKAATIGTRHRLAQWLYGVAYNTARKLREANGRRAKRECPLASAPEPAAVPTGAGVELLAVLDEEISRLPERYRAVIVLCDLEGLTRREVAKVLACPEGTVGGRLARARNLLAARLAARGVAPAATVLAAVLTTDVAAVSPLVAAVVVRAVSVDGLAHAAAEGLISARVAATTEKVLKAMFANKLRTIIASVLLCGLALAGAVGTIHFANAQFEPKPPSVGGWPPLAKPAVDSRPKALTIFPLKKLDPEATAKVISDSYKGKGATVAALPADKALMIYASEGTTRAITELLKTLGEGAPKVASVIRLDKLTDCNAATRMVTDAFGKSALSVVAVPDEHVLLVYATEADTQIVRKLLAKVAVADSAIAPPEPLAQGTPAEKVFSIHFDKVAWKDVLDWYAAETGLVMITKVVPTGSVTMKPSKDRKFTVAEVTDLINESMAQQKFILIRRHMTFFIHPTEEKIDSALVPRIELKELSKRGRTEIVQVIVPIRGRDTLDVHDEVQKLLTPFGQIFIANMGSTMGIMDTAGNITRILAGSEGPVEKNDSDSINRALEYRRAQEVAETLKTLLTDDKTTAELIGQDAPAFGGFGGGRGLGNNPNTPAPAPNARMKTVRIAVDARRNAILVVGSEDKIGLAKRIIEEMDKPLTPSTPKFVPAEPILKTIALTNLKAADVAVQLQKAFPLVRVITLTEQNQLMVLGTPEEHIAVGKFVHELETKSQPPKAETIDRPKPRTVEPRHIIEYW